MDVLTAAVYEFYCIVWYCIAGRITVFKEMNSLKIKEMNLLSPGITTSSSNSIQYNTIQHDSKMTKESFDLAACVRPTDDAPKKRIRRERSEELVLVLVLVSGNITRSFILFHSALPCPALQPPKRSIDRYTCTSQNLNDASVGIISMLLSRWYRHEVDRLTHSFFSSHLDD